MLKRIALGAATLLLLSCAANSGNTGNTGTKPQAGNGQSSIDAQVAAMTPCQKVEALITGHANGFPMLRKQQTHAKLMDVWKARYHLVGDSCQVWGWGKGQFSYVCSLTAPNKDTALHYYEKAKQLTAECLGPQWTQEEAPRKLGEGMKTLFVQAGSKTAVGMQAVSTPGLFKNEWTAYYFVGSPNDAL